MDAVDARAGNFDARNDACSMAVLMKNKTLSLGFVGILTAVHA